VSAQNDRTVSGAERTVRSEATRERRRAAEPADAFSFVAVERSDMDRRSPFDELESLLERLDTARDVGSGPAVDVRDVDERFDVVLDLPGFDSDDIEVEVQNRTVRVDATHRESSDAEGPDYVRKERSKRSVSRSVTLPEDVEESEASADFSQGVLTVTLPKAHADEESTSIDVE
jgi:HSP20 family protein